jgi:formate dehydrogenase subunit gamma
MTRYIQRHSLVARWVHGIVVASCLALIVTGLVLFIPGVPEALGVDLVQVVRDLHRVFAVAFIAAPLIGIALAPGGFMHFIRNLFSRWDADDRRFMRLFPKYLFACKTTHMPKQHELKSGQRFIDVVIIGASIVIAVTGLVMWLGAGSVSAAVMRWSLLLHGVCFIVIVVGLLGHAYLGAGVFQPYRGLWRLMFGNGQVSESDALYHWGYWAEDELASGRHVVEWLRPAWRSVWPGRGEPGPLGPAPLFGPPTPVERVTRSIRRGREGRRCHSGRQGLRRDRRRRDRSAPALPRGTVGHAARDRGGSARP